MCLPRLYSYKVFRSSSLEGSHLRAHFSLCLRAPLSTVLSRPPSLATNRRVTRASSIFAFSIFLAVVFLVLASCPPTRLEGALYGALLVARLCPICALTKCCSSRFIVSPHSHRCVTSGSLPRSRISIPLPIARPQVLRGRVLVLLFHFTFLLIELTRGPFVLASPCTGTPHTCAGNSTICAGARTLPCDSRTRRLDLLPHRQDADVPAHSPRLPRPHPLILR